MLALVALEAQTHMLRGNNRFCPQPFFAFANKSQFFLFLVKQIEPAVQAEKLGKGCHADPVKILVGVEFLGKVEESPQQVVLGRAEVIARVIPLLFPDPQPDLLQIRA